MLLENKYQISFRVRSSATSVWCGG